MNRTRPISGYTPEQLIDKLTQARHLIRHLATLLA